MSFPKTTEEWWSLLEANLEDIRNLVSSFHPFYRKVHDFPITARMAEKACESVRKSIINDTEKDPLEELEAARLNKNGEIIVNLLNDTWFGMPESMEVRSISGFFDLCNLCSECYLVAKEEYDEA